MEKAAALADEEGFVKADLEFHFAVAKAGHNHLLEQFYHLVRELLSEVITEMVALPKVKEESIVLQRAIAQAIEAKDTQRGARSSSETYAIHRKFVADLQLI